MNRWTSLKPLLWLVIINVILRTVWLSLMHPAQLYDFNWYFTHAVQIYQGQGFKIGPNFTAYWPIGYPYFLSLLFHLTGPTVLPGLVANASLSLGIVLMVYCIAKKVSGQTKVAFVAGVAYSLLPSQIEWNSVLGSEELYTFLLLLSLFIYLQATGQRWIRWTLLSGLILGLACTVRPIPLLFPAAVLVYEVWVMRRGWGRAFAQAVLFGVACLVGICPVTIRNAIALHHLVLVSTNGGVNLWQGTKANGSYFWSWNKYVNPLLAAGSNEILENSIGVHAFLHYVTQHPFVALLNGFKKVFFLYWVDWNVVGVTFQAISPPISRAGVLVAMWLDTAVYWLWMAVAALGLVRVFRRGDGLWRRMALPLLYILYNSGLFLVFPAWDRFRYPLMPLFALFFAWGWVTWVNPLRTRGK